MSGKERARASVRGRVLVIDDEPTIRVLFEHVLTGHVDGVQLADSAEAGLALAVTMPDLDLVVVDKNLPDRSGLEVIRELRASRPEVKCILITGYASMGSAIEAVEAGALHYLTKPFDDVEEIRLLVTRALERRQLERDLAAARQRHQRLFDVSPDAIVVYDVATGRITDANDSACRLYGYSRDELLGLMPKDLAMPSASKSEWDDHRDTLVTGLTRRRDRTRDGAPLEVEAAIAGFVEDGREFLMEVIRDTTPQVKNQSERAALEEQLGQAQRLEPLGRLTAGIAHDINNLLGIILASAEMLANELGDGAETVSSEMQVDVDNIVETVERGAWLTRQLLAFGRPRVSMAEPVEVGPSLASAVKLIHRVIGANVEIEIVVDDDAGSIMIDRGHFDQILLNLAINARDAIGPSGTISFHASRQPGAERTVVVSVTDDGIGMSPDTLARVFEPFFTTKSSHGGTGLGLATVKMLVERANGTIEVRSSPGEGTRFDLAFHDTDLKPAAAIEVPLDRLRGAGEPVLVVEDDARMRKLIRRMLERARYTVLEAAAPEEAMHQARRHAAEVAAAVVDVNLARMSGIDLVARLRGLHPDLPAIYISAAITGEAMARIESDAAAAFLAKPFREVQLLMAVRRAVTS